MSTDTSDNCNIVVKLYLKRYLLNFEILLFLAEDVKPVFGVPLAIAVDRSKCHDSIPLPAIFRECIDYIQEFGKYIVM